MLRISNEFAYRVMTGGPIIMVASKSKDGVNDVMTCAWNCPFASDEMLVVLDLGHTTTQNIIDTKKLVICIASIDMANTMLAVGNVHARDCGDKFIATNTKGVEIFENNIVVPQGCMAYMDCSLINETMLKETGICHVKVNNVFVDEKYWDKANNHFGEGMKYTAHHVCEATLISGNAITSFHRG